MSGWEMVMERSVYRLEWPDAADLNRVHFLARTYRTKDLFPLSKWFS